MTGTAFEALNSTQKHFKRLGLLKAERASWVPHYQELSRIMLPRSGRFFEQDRNRGEKNYNEIYDNSATRALRVLGAGLMGGATSPARPWFRYSVADPDLMKRPAVKAWCSKVTQIALDILQKSNTYRALQTIYEELGVFGTAANILMDDFEKVINHYPSTCGEYMLAANYRGEVDTIYREFEKPVVSVVGEFGFDNCSDTVKNLYSRGAYETWVPIVHAIEPRLDRDLGKLDQKNMKFTSCYFERDQTGAGKYLREGGMKKFRALCPRWAAAGGDIYGNGPGMEAFGDTRQLQHEQLRKAEGIDYQTKPSLQVPTSYKNRESDRYPGGLMHVDSNGQSSGVRPAFEVRLDLSALLDDIQDVRERIRGSFYTDLFLMLSSQQDSEKTATEVAELHEEKLLMLGPVLERLHNELFSPLVDAVFERMVLTGLLPPPPPEMQGAQLNVEFISMLAQAQRAVETNSIDRFVNSMGTIIEVTGDPSVSDKFDKDKWADKYSDMLGIDPELIVSDDKVALVRQNRAKAQQQAAATANAESQSKTAKNLAQAPTTGGNALSDVTNAFSGYSTPQNNMQQ